MRLQRWEQETRRVSEWLKSSDKQTVLLSKISPLLFPSTPRSFFFIFKAVDVVIKNFVRAWSGHLVSQIRTPSEILSSVLLRRQR